VLDDVEDRHTLRIYNTYSFSTETVVTRTRLSVILYAHNLICYNFLIFIYGEVLMPSPIQSEEDKFEVKRIDMF